MVRGDGSVCVACRAVEARILTYKKARLPHHKHPTLGKKSVFVVTICSREYLACSENITILISKIEYRNRMTQENISIENIERILGKYYLEKYNTVVRETE